MKMIDFLIHLIKVMNINDEINIYFYKKGKILNIKNFFFSDNINWYKLYSLKDLKKEVI